MKKTKEEIKKERDVIPEKIKWTDEQTEIIGQMIKESEMIGWTQGYDEAVKELIQELETKIFELKKMIYIKKND